MDQEICECVEVYLQIEGNLGVNLRNGEHDSVIPSADSHCLIFIGIQKGRMTVITF